VTPVRQLVEGGTIVTASDAFRGDVLIDGERIRAVGADLGDVAGVERRIDADGCLVLPGLVDNHTHLELRSMGTVSADDYETGTAAAAAGGTTTIVDFAAQTDGSLMTGLRDWQDRARARAHVDYGFHMTVVDASPPALAEMAEVVAAGTTSFKVFMAYKGSLMMDDAGILAVLRRAGEVGGLVCVHAEHGDAVAMLASDALEAGHVEPRFHAATRPPSTEAEATARAIRLAEWTGQSVFIVHVTCAEALAEIERGRAHGLSVLAETCVQYLVLTSRELERPGFEGAKYVCSPPLRGEADQQVLWRALREGVLQGCSTDHCPFDYRGQKDLGRDDFTKIPNGLPVIEHRLSLLYEQGVRRGLLSSSELVEVAATGPARVFGLAPRKGSIVPGADADLVVFDPAASFEISARTHRMNVDYSAFEGFRGRGAARTVLSRGDVVVDEGEVISRPGRGRFLARAPFRRSAATAVDAASRS
jgi:dihydropyrimidinase